MDVEIGNLEAARRVPTKYFADLSAAWFRERVRGLTAGLLARGWIELPWITETDWFDLQWIDNVHPTRSGAATVLMRLLAHIPLDEHVIVIGDSTTTFHLNEAWSGGRLHWDWPARETFMMEAGYPNAELWAVPGEDLPGILWQARTAARSRPTAVLLVGGWNQHELPIDAYLDAITAAFG